MSYTADDVLNVNGYDTIDISGDATLRSIRNVNIKTNTALATLAGLPSDVSSFASSLSSLTNDVTKLKNI